MYFEEAPKTSKKDLFDYIDEFQKLLLSLSEGRRMIQIKGRRRSGKTSLLLSCLNELKRPYLVLDGRAFSAPPQVRRENFIRLLDDSLNEFLRNNTRMKARIIDALRGVSGLNIGIGANPSISLRWGPKQQDAVNVSSIFDALSKEALRQKTRFIIAFDEAQEFRKIMRYDLTSVLAHSYDYCKGLQFVVTGSEIGTLHRFLRVDDENAPLYGRAMVEIELLGLSGEESRKYLREGFAQVKLRVSDEMIDSACLRFDGVIGWLTYCGFKASEYKKLDRKTIDIAAGRASKLVAGEFKNFKNMHKSNRYNLLLRNLSRGISSWAELKRALEAREGAMIGQGEITKLLFSLEEAGFVGRKDSGAYYIPDPMVTEAALNGLI